MKSTLIVNQGSLWKTTVWVLLSIGTHITSEEEDSETICMFLDMDEKANLVFFVQNEAKYLSISPDLIQFWIRDKWFKNIFEGNPNHKCVFETNITLDTGTPITT